MLYSALGFGLIPIFALLAYRGGINVITLLAIRFVLSGLVLLAFLLARGRRVLAQVAAVLPGLIGPGGVLHAAVRVLLLRGALHHRFPGLDPPVLLSGASSACWPSWWRGKSWPPARCWPWPFPWRGWCWSWAPPWGRPSPVGVLLALGAAAVYSLYITLANRVLRRVEPVVALSVVTLVTSVLYIGLGLAAGRLSFAFAPSTWLPIVLIIVVSTLLAILAFFRGIGILGSSTASIVSMTEPLFTIGFSILLFGDRLGWQQIVGGVLVLGGTVLVTAFRSPARTRS